MCDTGIPCWRLRDQSDAGDVVGCLKNELRSTFSHVKNTKTGVPIRRRYARVSDVDEMVEFARRLHKNVSDLARAIGARLMDFDDAAQEMLPWLTDAEVDLVLPVLTREVRDRWTRDAHSSIGHPVNLETQWRLDSAGRVQPCKVWPTPELVTLAQALVAQSSTPHGLLTIDEARKKGLSRNQAEYDIKKGRLGVQLVDRPSLNRGKQKLRMVMEGAVEGVVEIRKTPPGRDRHGQYLPNRAPRKKAMGRPAGDADEQREDAHLAALWKTGRFLNHADLARDQRKSVGAVKKALDRARKRL
jgi:hypothetical protein